MAWRVPELFVNGTENISVPENSMVPYMQKRLFDAVQNALAAISADISQGFRLTVGLESEWFTEYKEKTSVIVNLPENADIDYIVKAVNAENLEAWSDDEKRFHVAISPWFSTKEVDHVVLCTIKVVHEFTGLLDIDINDHGHSHD